MSIPKINRMHTAEHLLSAVMRKFYKAPRNLEFHLNEKKTKCDYAPKPALTDEDFPKIEDLVNQEITLDHQVADRLIARMDAGNFDLWKVPAGVDEIRIVEIGDFDAQPCRGRHVERTSQIGVFRLLSHGVRENGRIRLRFKVE